MAEESAAAVGLCGGCAVEVLDVCGSAEGVCLCGGLLCDECVGWDVVGLCVECVSLVVCGVDGDGAEDDGVWVVGVVGLSLLCDGGLCLVWV